MNALNANSFRTGISFARRGFGLITKPGVRLFVIGPMMINLLVFGGAIYALGYGFDYFLDQFLPSWLEALRWLLWPLFALAIGALVFFTFALLANLLASPLNGLLADSVEAHLRPGKASTTFTWRHLATEVGRTIKAELRKLGYILLRAIPIFILSLIPGLNLAAAPAWLLFGAWMLSVEYVDCPMGNNGAPFPAVLRHLRQNRRTALGFGGVIMVLTVIPGANLLALPVGVAGATALYVDVIAPGET
ncbi:MAG: sulfate transporter CysZ [Pseudomonadota bacterium]